MEFIENKEEEQKQLNGIFKDMIKYSPSKIIGTIGNAIIVPVYTSLLPPEQYGIYSLSIAFLSFLCIIFSDWVGLSGLRFFRQHQLAQDLSKYLSVLVSILGLNLFLMFALCLIFQGNFCSFFKIDPKYFYAVLFLIIPVAIRALLFQLLRAQLKSASYTFSKDPSHRQPGSYRLSLYRKVSQYDPFPANPEKSIPHSAPAQEK